MSPEEWLASQNKDAAAAGMSPEEWMASQKAAPAAPAAPPQDLTKAAFVPPRGIRPRGAADVAKQQELEQQFGRTRPAEFSGVPAYLAAGTESAAMAAPVGAGLGAMFGGGVPGAVAGGAAAIPLGFFGGLASQAAKDIGFGPGTQMLAGMAPMPGGQAVTQNISRAVTPATERVGAALFSALPYRIRAGLQALSAKPTESLTDAARQAILAGTPQGRAAETVVGEAAKRGAGTAVAGARTEAEAQKAAIEAKYQAGLEQQRARVAAMRGELSKAKAAEQQATNQAAAEVSNLTPVSPSELGGEAQTILNQRLDALKTERSTEYETLFKDYIDFARSEQAAGRPWQLSEQGKSTIGKLEGLLTPTEEMGKGVRALTADEEKAVRAVLDDLQGVRKVQVTEPYPETQIIKQPLDIKGIDNVVRKLGEAAKGRPAEGYDAIGKQLALDMKQMITEGLYNWAPAGSAAKQSYREGSKKLESFVESQISSITDTSNKIRGKLTTDPQGVGKTLFKSTQSVEDLKNALGGDMATVQRLAKQHVNNELYNLGGNPAKVEQWLSNPKNKEWMKAAGIETHGQEFLTNLKDFTAKAEGAAKGVATGEAKLTPEKLRARDVAIGEAKTKALENVRSQASAYEKRISTVINAGKFEGETLEKVLSSGSKKNIQTIGALMDDAGRQAMPDAIRQYMSRSSPANLGNNWDKLKPMLEYGKLMDASQIAKLDADVAKAVQLMGKTPTRKQINQLGVLISGRVAGALGGMAVSE
jgi:hypothetical protein